MREILGPLFACVVFATPVVAAPLAALALSRLRPSLPDDGIVRRAAAVPFILILAYAVLFFLIAVVNGPEEGQGRGLAVIVLVLVAPLLFGLSVLGRPLAARTVKRLGKR